MISRLLFWLWVLPLSAEQLTREHLYTTHREELTSYFLDVALGLEFTDEHQVTKKWLQPLRIYCQGRWPAHLQQELTQLVSELNELTRPGFVSVVAQKHRANFVAYYGRARDYARYVEPKAEPYLRENYGFFYIHWALNYNLYKGSLYIDAHRAQKPEFQRHLLREELTQALGLMNDSPRYPDSVFYSESSLSTSYSALDQALISLLYNPMMKPKMSRQQAQVVLQRIIEAQNE